MSAEYDVNRATILAINDTFFPTTKNLMFVDYEEDDMIPTTKLVDEELYNENVKFDQSTGGLRFPPEIQSKETL
jgi:hypothetical protein